MIDNEIKKELSALDRRIYVLEKHLKFQNQLYSEVESQQERCWKCNVIEPLFNEYVCKETDCPHGLNTNDVK